MTRIREPVNEFNPGRGTGDEKPRLPLQFPNSESDECLLSFDFGVAEYPVGALQDIAFHLHVGPSPPPRLARSLL